jgi:hypothetical protein
VGLLPKLTYLAVNSNRLTGSFFPSHAAEIETNNSPEVRLSGQEEFWSFIQRSNPRLIIN